MHKQGTNPGEVASKDPKDYVIDHLAMFAAEIPHEEVVEHCNLLIQVTSGIVPEQKQFPKK